MTTPRQSRPSRTTIEGRAYLDLRARAKEDGRATAEYLRFHLLEGFLMRLSVSARARTFVLKGGVLLAAYDLRRPTADIDFAAKAVANDVEHVREVVQEISEIALPPSNDDGIRFDSATARAETIRDGDEYSGVRVTLRAHLATASETFHVDVNVGDPIWPAPQAVSVPRILGGEIPLLGYPISMILAEKIVTALQRDITNTRWRDFADIYLLSGYYACDASEIREALSTVAAHRTVTLVPLSVVLNGYVDAAQSKWRAWRSRQGMESMLPEQFAEVLDAVFRFTEPVLAAVRSTDVWLPHQRRWQNR